MKINQHLILKSLREIIFGLEDGMVSTMGVVTGIAGGTQDKFVIILSGLVIISVESLSMAAGTYLSNKAEKESSGWLLKRLFFRRYQSSVITSVKQNALFMGLAYILGGIIPLVPYFLLPISLAIPLSVVATVFGLGTVGIIKAKYTNASLMGSALEMIAISLSAAALGYVIGTTVSSILPN